jgi:hypothetical protein
MLLEMLSAVTNDSTACRVDGTALMLLACVGLLYPQVVNSPQAGDCDRSQTDSATFQRPAQLSNSLASITGVAIQSIFQYLEVASAARLASTCKVCFDEHRHQGADIYERAYQQLTPEVTVEFFHSYGHWDCSGVAIVVHWADEELLLQMYRIALHRKALQEFWSFVWPANLHELIWTAVRKIGEYDRLAHYCKHYAQIPFCILWIKVVISCKQWKSPLPDACAHDGSFEKAAVESLGSAWEHASVSLSVAQQAVDTNGGVGIYRESFCHGLMMEDAHSSANGLEDNDSDRDEAHSMLAPDPEIVWDSFVDWMHEVPSEHMWSKIRYLHVNQLGNSGAESTCAGHLLSGVDSTVPTGRRITGSSNLGRG